MKIACNLSKELMELIDEEKVFVDYVKIYFSKSNDIIPNIYKKYGSLLLHGVGTDIPQHTGAADLENINWNQIQANINFCSSSFIGLHCETYKADWQQDDITFEMIKERMGNTLELWRAKTGIDLLIENLPYKRFYEAGKPKLIKTSVYPKLINELCIEHNVNLLLDIAHAKVTSSTLAIPIKEYLTSLPLDRVKEIHVVGTNSTENGLRDNHLEMQEEDYKLLEFVLKRTKPEIVTLEYGGFGDHFSWRSDKGAIERQLNSISAIVNAEH